MGYGKTNQSPIQIDNPNIGELSALNTQDKSSLVAAINDNVAQLADIMLDAVNPIGTGLQGLVKGTNGKSVNNTNLNTLLNYCSTNNKKLWIPGGQYHFSGTITMNYPGVSIEGESRVATQFILDATDNFDLFALQNYCTIENIGIWVNNTSFSSALFKLYTTTTGNYYGIVDNIKVDHSGTTNTTKVIAIVNTTNGTQTESAAYWKFKQFKIYGANTIVYHNVYNSAQWTSALTFRDFDFDMSVNGVNMVGQGLMSAFVFDNWLYQTESISTNVFNALITNSRINIMVYDWNQGTKGNPITFQSGSVNNILNFPSLQQQWLTFNSVLDRAQNTYQLSPIIGTDTSSNPNFTHTTVSEAAESNGYAGLQDNYLWNANKNFAVTVYDKATGLGTALTVNNIDRMFSPVTPFSYTSITGCTGLSVCVQIDFTTPNLKVLNYADTNNYYKLSLAAAGVVMYNNASTRTFRDISVEYYDTTTSTWKSIFDSYDSYRNEFVQAPLGARQNPINTAEMYYYTGFLKHLNTPKIRFVFNNYPTSELDISYLFARNELWATGGHYIGLQGGNSWNDIAFLDSTKGIVLKDRTNGGYYRLVVNNGALSVESD